MSACHFCNVEILDPSARSIYKRVSGWQTKGTGETRKGGSDIVLRETTGEIACGTCIERLKSNVPAGQTSFDIDLSQRTEPLCADCFAEITWVLLPRSGKRMPVERTPLRITEPRRGFVLVSGSQGCVLRESDLPAARNRMAEGARLHYPHRFNCPAQKKAAA